MQDFRKLNEASFDDKYSLPEVQQCIDNIGKANSKIFSSLDLTSGFWQLALHRNSQEPTAFSVPGRGRYHCYIDDILVHSASFEQHLEHLRKCFLRLRQHNLKLNLAKCHFGAQKIDYLGHSLTPLGVKPNQQHLTAVSDFPEPQTVKQIREFTGLTNYFRQYIPNYTLTSSVLTQLTQKNSPWKKGPLPPTARSAFLKLKEALITAPILSYPKSNLPYLLSVDAATGDELHAGGLGAVLSQKLPDGSEKVIAYASRPLTSYEKNYTPYLLEMAAAVWATFTHQNLDPLARTDERVRFSGHLQKRL